MPASCGQEAKVPSVKLDTQNATVSKSVPGVAGTSANSSESDGNVRFGFDSPVCKGSSHFHFFDLRKSYDISRICRTRRLRDLSQIAAKTHRIASLID